MIAPKGNQAAAPRAARARTKSRSTAADKLQASATPTSEPRPSADPQIDASLLESLVGYNARRAAVTAMGTFVQRMAEYDLRPVEFSVLSLVRA